MRSSLRENMTIITMWAASFLFSQSQGFCMQQLPRSQSRATSSLLIVNAKKQTTVLEEEEAPAGIAGAAFFGGAKEKEVFYNELDEQAAAVTLALPTVSSTSVSTVEAPKTSVNRFTDRDAFASDRVAQIAQSLQSQFNSALYEGAPTPDTSYLFTQSKLDWISPVNVDSPTPLDELSKALEFYKNVDIAIISGQEGVSSDQLELQWELSVVWPTFWAPRVLLLGSSTITLDGTTIVGQLDKVVDNGGDLLGLIANQIWPRFWDWYHIGMTPSAELMPRINLKQPSLFGLNYQTYDIPARWVAQPSILDSRSRDDANAQTLPNHSFSTAIKTMGPTRERYVPTTPVEVQFKSSNNRLEWKIPLAVEFQMSADWPLPGEDEEAEPGTDPRCEYIYQPRRKVATVAYGGAPQDKEVSDLRKRLYEQVLKDGFTPKLDATTERPIFFFLQNTVKACYTKEGGLGMVVYEWRPRVVKPNEVGIELELPGERQIVVAANDLATTKSN